MFCNTETTAKDIKENNVADKIKRIKPALKKKEEGQVEVKLPQGNSSITVSGIDLAPEDAGNVFQFLEFCSAFGKVSSIPKHSLIIKYVLEYRNFNYIKGLLITPT